MALSQTTGKVDTSWQPSADSIHGVFGLQAYGQSACAGGDFTRWFPCSFPQAHFAEFSYRGHRLHAAHGHGNSRS